jgi:hypothetical protein
MVETHTFQNRTFRLEESIGYNVDAFRDFKATVDIYATAPYATQVEHGHPGPPPARPYPFFWPVYYKHEPLLWERLEATVETSLGA